MLYRLLGAIWLSLVAGRVRFETLGFLGLSLRVVSSCPHRACGGQGQS